MTTPSSSAPAVPPVTEALRTQAAQQRGGYVYAIDPYFAPNGAVPPYGIVGGWSVDSSGQLVSFTHNPNYRPSPRALEFPTPVTALDEALQRAVTGYGSEQELLAAFRDATLLLFTQEGQTGLSRPGAARSVRVVRLWNRPQLLRLRPGSPLLSGLP
ncbi:type VII secretion system-associated protein [Streptomyces sp. NPDC048637]|uniref:type VII secretion system-associated protein n=1 Tax=Streptomyces sp. NPDC048637 TaxID=3155636 RepID=UPI00341432C1